MNPETQEPSIDGVTIRQPESFELGAVRTLRHEELIGDRELEALLEASPDDLKSTAIHMAAFKDRAVVSAVRIDPVEDVPGTFMVSRMVTRAPYRGHGIGAKVLTQAEVVAAEHGAETFILDARPKAVPFYARLGYARSGKHTPAKHEEVAMIKSRES